MKLLTSISIFLFFSLNCLATSKSDFDNPDNLNNKKHKQINGGYGVYEFVLHNNGCFVLYYRWYDGNGKLFAEMPINASSYAGTTMYCPYVMVIDEMC